jgi:uncharacterized membrane protein
VSHHPEAMRLGAIAGNTIPHVIAVAIMTTAIVHIIIQALLLRLQERFIFSSEKLKNQEFHLMSSNNVNASISSELTQISCKILIKSGGVYESALSSKFLS